MKLNTSILFHLLLRPLAPDLVCDVGTMDGTHARRFRRLLPDSRIVAFEANPHNVAQMRSSDALERQRIELEHVAAWNEDGETTFCIERVTAKDLWRRGISSTRPRLRGSLGRERSAVAATRLDSWMAKLDPPIRRAALWVDVEGASFEVLQGIAGCAERVVLVQAEVEGSAVWEGQKLGSDVDRLMRSMGFVPLARGIPEMQHDVIYVNARVLNDRRLRIRLLVLVSWLLTRVQGVAGRLVGAASRRFFRAG